MDEEEEKNEKEKEKKKEEESSVWKSEGWRVDPSRGRVIPRPHIINPMSNLFESEWNGVVLAVLAHRLDQRSYAASIEPSRNFQRVQGI